MVVISRLLHCGQSPTWGLFRKRGIRRYMVAYYQNRPHSHLAWHMSFIHNLYSSSATPLLAFLTTVTMTNVIYTIHDTYTLPSLLSLYSVNSHFSFLTTWIHRNAMIQPLLLFLFLLLLHLPLLPHVRRKIMRWRRKRLRRRRLLLTWHD